MRRAHTSVDHEYSQWAPGWKRNGCWARAATRVSSVAPLPRPRALPAGDGGEVETGLGRAVANAGHVHHRVSHRDRPLGVHQTLRLTVEPLDHLHVAELRKEAVHGVIELEQTPLVQGEERDPGDGLGHRVEPPDGVVENGTRSFAIHQAERAVVRDLIRAGDNDLAAGELARFEVPRAQVLVDPLESAAVEPGSVGIDLHSAPRLGGASRR